MLVGLLRGMSRGAALPARGKHHPSQFFHSDLNSISNSFQRIGPWPILSKSRDVRLCVCVFVPFHALGFEAYFAPTSRSRMSKNFRDSESLGKSNGKNWSQIGTFLCGRSLKSPRKKSLFLLLILPYKTCWKPRSSMDEIPLVEGYIANFSISLDVFEFFRFGLFFSI